jgi:hypothetical protein
VFIGCFYNDLQLFLFSISTFDSHLIIPYGFFCLCHIPPKLNVGTSIPPIKSNIFLTSSHHFTINTYSIHKFTCQPSLGSKIVDLHSHLDAFFHQQFPYRTLRPFTITFGYVDMYVSMFQYLVEFIYLSLHRLNTPKLMVGYFTTLIRFDIQYF